MGCHPSHWRTHIFQRGRYTTNQCTYEAFLTWGIPKTMGFNTKSCSNDLDDFGVPPWLRKPPYEIPWCKRLHRCGLHMVFRSNDRQAASWEVSGPHGPGEAFGMGIWHWCIHISILIRDRSWNWRIPYRIIFVLSSLHKSHKSYDLCFNKHLRKSFAAEKNGSHVFSIQRCNIPKIPWSLKIILIYYPIGSMYGIYANIWGILMVHVTIYSIHGSYGYCRSPKNGGPSWNFPPRIRQRDGEVPMGSMSAVVGWCLI